MLGFDVFFTFFFLVAALAVVGFVIFLFFSGTLIWFTMKNLRAPKVQWVATVVAKRQQVSGASEGTSTVYFVTFETPTKERREFAVKGTQFGYLIQGDEGTVHTQGTWFRQFDRTR